MMIKRSALLIIAVLVVAPTLFGQGREMTVEEAYLQEAMEMMIIRETSRADGREQKFIALEFIRNALERGSTNEEIQTALVMLAREGTMSQARERGRVMNNFPDIRREAARYLGMVNTPESQAALIEIVRPQPGPGAEAEPMVLMEAVISLGAITAGEDDKAVEAIVHITNRFDRNTPPDNLLALAAIDSLERIAQRNNGQLDAAAVQLLIRLSIGDYAQSVRQKAAHVRNNLRGLR